MNVILKGLQHFFSAFSEIAHFDTIYNNISILRKMLLGGIHIIWSTTLKIILIYSLGLVKFMTWFFLKE